MLLPPTRDVFGEADVLLAVELVSDLVYTVDHNYVQSVEIFIKMSEWIDRKYAGLISQRLERFEVKSHQPYLANFRCFICGDSKKNKWKARGFIFTKKGGLFFKCHNCNHSSSLGNLIKQLDQTLYKQYTMERYAEGGHHRQSHANVQSVLSFDQPVFKPKSILDQLLDKVNGTPAEAYLQQRQIPKCKWDLLYYIDDVGKIEQLSDKYKDRIVGNDSRLVLPFYNRQGKLVGVSCRAIGDSRLRYITVRIDESQPMIFNLDGVDFDQTVYVTEGPIDSLFVNNSVAVGNSDLKAISAAIPKERVVLVYDNQPRNKQLIQAMSQAIDDGYAMVIWPQDISDKDINEMVVNGMTDIQSVIEQNTYRGLKLALAFNAWKKV